VAVGFDLGEDAGDLALGINDEGSALDAHHLFAVHVLLFDHAVGVADFLIGVGEERVGQVVLVLELLLFFRSVGGDAEYDGARLFDLLECVAEPARFYGSTGGIGLGEKEQDDRLSAKILQ
jgi:hypothetical protein